MYSNSNTACKNVFKYKYSIWYFENTSNTCEYWPSSEVPLLRLVRTKNDIKITLLVYPK